MSNRIGSPLLSMPKTVAVIKAKVGANGTTLWLNATPAKVWPTVPASTRPNRRSMFFFGQYRIPEILRLLTVLPINTGWEFSAVLPEHVTITNSAMAVTYIKRARSDRPLEGAGVPAKSPATPTVNVHHALVARYTQGVPTRTCVCVKDRQALCKQWGELRGPEALCRALLITMTTLSKRSQTIVVHDLATYLLLTQQMGPPTNTLANLVTQVQKAAISKRISFRLGNSKENASFIQKTRRRIQESQRIPATPTDAPNQVLWNMRLRLQDGKL